MPQPVDLTEPRLAEPVGSQPVEITLRDYVRVLFRRKWVILATLVGTIAATLLGLQLKTPAYEAQVKMLISAQKQVESPFYRDLAGSRNSEVALTQSEIVKSNPVLERAVKALNLYQRPLDYEAAFASPLKAKLVRFQARRLATDLEPRPQDQQQLILFRQAVEDLRNHLTVEPIRGTDLFTIRVRDFSPVGAAITANTVSRSYVIFDLQQQLAEVQVKYGEKHQAVRQLDDNIERMAQNLHGGPISDLDAIGTASVKIVEQANIPLEPSGPRGLMVAILGVVMGVFLAVMLAFVFEYADQTVRSPQELEGVLRAPCIGWIPKRQFWNRAVVSNLELASPYANAMRGVADQLFAQTRSQGVRSVLLTATLPSEGVTTIVANLGQFLSRRDNCRVLLIDANHRSPSLHRLLGAAQQPGLAEVLDGRANLDQAIHWKSERLAVLPAGKPGRDPGVALDSPGLRAVLESVTERFELVLLDGPETRNFKDSVSLAAHVDAVALIVRDGKVRRQALKRMLSSLGALRTKLLGAILSDRRFAVPKFVYDWT